MSVVAPFSQVVKRAAARRARGLSPALLALMLVLVLPAPVHAEIGRDQAAAAAQRQTGGRVLSVDRAGFDGRIVWRVKVVTPDGEVRVVFIDAGAAGRRGG